MPMRPTLRLPIIVLAAVAAALISACGGSNQDQVTVTDKKEVQGAAVVESFRVDNKSGTVPLQQYMRAQKQYTHEITITPNAGVKMNTQQVRAEILKLYNVSESRTTEDQVCVIPVDVPAGQVYLYDMEWREVWREGIVNLGQPDNTPEALYRFKQSLVCNVVEVRPVLGASVTSTIPGSVVTTNVPFPTPMTPTAFPTVAIQAIESEWPRTMDLERSNSVRVTLVYTDVANITPIIEVPGNVVSISTPIPMGTPGLIQNAFGADYRASISAQLAGSAFDVQPVTDGEYQIFNQTRTTWEWNVVPKYSGPQVLNLAVVVKWEPIKGGLPIQYQMWRQRLEVNVQAPILVSGRPIELFSIIIGVFGAISGSLLTFFGPKVYEKLIERHDSSSRARTKKISKNKKISSE